MPFPILSPVKAAKKVRGEVERASAHLEREERA